MPKILNGATAVLVLAFAAMGAAQARGNFDRDSYPFSQPETREYPGYAGPAYSQPPRAFNNRGPQIKGYGCLAHPDYGLYVPHFC